MIMKTKRKLKHREDGKTEYDGGATRSTIEERWTLLPMDSLRAAARVMARGAEIHGEHNWRNGIPIEDCLDHVIDHVAKYVLGDRSEDHLAHAVCGLLMSWHFANAEHQKKESD